jgi:hypothetical protein
MGFESETNVPFSSCSSWRTRSTDFRSATLTAKSSCRQSGEPTSTSARPPPLMQQPRPSAPWTRTKQDSSISAPAPRMGFESETNVPFSSCSSWRTRSTDFRSATLIRRAYLDLGSSTSSNAAAPPKRTLDPNKTGLAATTRVSSGSNRECNGGTYDLVCLPCPRVEFGCVRALADFTCSSCA